ncbi:MAG: NUDIX hydrolase [Candidatus Saccharimonadales bacterium]
MPTYTVEESRDWYNNLPGKRVSAATIIRRDDTVLMVKANYRDWWTFPGGVVDPGESPLRAAIRETHEEVGLQYREDEATFFSVNYIPEVNGFSDRIQFFFELPLAHDQQVTLAVGEIEAYEWVAVQDIGVRATGRASYAYVQQKLELPTFPIYHDE